jgi:hypothetical protein
VALNCWSFKSNLKDYEDSQNDTVTSPCPYDATVICPTPNKRGKFVFVHSTKAYRGSRVIAPILNLGVRLIGVVRFTPQLLYPREKNPGTH